MGHEGRWSLYGGQNESAKALSGLTKVAFIKRWPSYRVATIDRFHSTTYMQCVLIYASLDFQQITEVEQNQCYDELQNQYIYIHMLTKPMVQYYIGVPCTKTLSKV